jgi:hypothetical protein
MHGGLVVAAALRRISDRLQQRLRDMDRVTPEQWLEASRALRANGYDIDLFDSHKTPLNPIAPRVRLGNGEALSGAELRARPDWPVGRLIFTETHCGVGVSVVGDGVMVEQCRIEGFGGHGIQVRGNHGLFRSCEVRS